MQTQISGIFGSYDLFAKAFPGTIFLLCAISLLPQQAFNFELAQSGALIAALTIFILVVGFAFGQVVHSTSVAVEKIFYWLSRKLFEKSTVIRSIFYDEYDGKILIFGREMERSKYNLRIARVVDTTISTIVVVASFVIISIEQISAPLSDSFLAGIIIGGITGIAILYNLTVVDFLRDWIGQTLIPHRRQFGVELSDIENEGKKENWLPRSFIDKIDEKYQVEDGTKEGSAVDLLYTLVMSHLAHRSVGRARQFQAVFAFCRSMWVTMYIYSILFLFIGLGKTNLRIYPSLQEQLTGLSNYSPIILSQAAGPNPLIVIAIAMFVTGFLFMEGERQYKSLFVDYVMADFLTMDNI